MVDAEGTGPEAQFTFKGAARGRADAPPAPVKSRRLPLAPTRAAQRRAPRPQPAAGPAARPAAGAVRRRR
jgi:hypothetical protein